MSAPLIKLFPDLPKESLEKLEALSPLYAEWNARINVISRKDMDHFFERHVLHSLALTMFWEPESGHKVIDIGTGGGFPGIPLAICFPKVDFLLVDSIGKKIKVVNEVKAALDLPNVTAIQERAENVPGKFDVAVTRAVARLETLAQWSTHGRMKVKKLYALKGGDLREEVEEVDRFPSMVYNLNTKLPGEFFATKKVVMVQFS